MKHVPAAMWLATVDLFANTKTGKTTTELVEQRPPPRVITYRHHRHHQEANKALCPLQGLYPTKVQKPKSKTDLTAIMKKSDPKSILTTKRRSLTETATENSYRRVATRLFQKLQFS